MLDALVSAIDSLLNFAGQEHPRGLRPSSDFLELLRLDQEVASLCQVTGLPLPTVTYEGNYGGAFAGTCGIPVSRYTEGIKVWQDRGWLIALRGLRRTAELEQARRRRQEEASGEVVCGEPPRQPASAGRFGSGPASGQGDVSEVSALWESDPIRTFERLRDRVCDAVQLVVEAHRRALAAPPGQSLADVWQEQQGALRQAVVEGQAIWFDTPIARYLDRPEGPVYLDRLKERTIGRVSGSCNHDLALGLAVGLWRWIEECVPASDYTASMRFYTAAGDHIGEHLTGLTALVRCECQQGIARWKAESIRALKMSNFSPAKLDPSRCPGCQAPVPEEYSTLSRVLCLACERWELNTGLIVTPVAGLPGTPPEVIRAYSPYWQPCPPDRVGNGDDIMGREGVQRQHTGGTEDNGSSAKRRKPGRPLDTDPKDDERIFDAWSTGQHKTYEDLARELKVKKRKVEAAIDRHRKRLERGGK